MGKSITTIWLTETPHICKDLVERLMEKDSLDHDWVELVGGPLDGKRLKEEGSKFEHNASQLYVINGCQYKPLKVIRIGDKNVLKLGYIGPYKGV